jgi:H2-forming N5,N10-methylenetetrahydromethanopterin dehydrogenase-like enzyme
MKMKNANKLEIYYSNFELEYKVNNIDEAYKIVSDLLNNPNIEMVDLLDITVFYNGDPNIIEMVE